MKYWFLFYQTDELGLCYFYSSWLQTVEEFIQYGLLDPVYPLDDIV